MPTTDRLVGGSPPMLRLLAQIERAAAIDIPMIIHGETGVGKELVAAAIHRGRGSERSFVAVNVAALPEQLVEAELFGAAQGAYTGAVRPRPGLVEHADGGTLLLDEAADLPRAIQATLLRTLDSGEVRRIGATARRRIRFRLLVATQVPPESLVESGRWRHDFYYRVAGAVVHVPPLRERLADVPELVNHFLTEAGHPPVAAERLAGLSAFTWPGNVRQLRLAVDRMLFEESGMCAPARLLAVAQEMHARLEAVADVSGRLVVASLEEAEASHVRRALTAAENDTHAAAGILGISRSQLYRRMRALGIATPRRRSGPHRAPGGSGAIRASANTCSRIREEDDDSLSAGFVQPTAD